ncbi:MAG: lysophospholipid acyltransferase family protein [Bacteroidia bacterium]
MQAFFYYLSLPFIYLIAILPMPLLYGLSNLFYVLMYYVIGYRKNVVFTNLKNSFPDKNNNEIHLIAKKFYKYLCDLMLETFKTLVFSKKQAIRAFEIDAKTIDMINDYAAKNQSLIFVAGHHGNWEWSGNALAQQYKGVLYIIYHKLSNKYFDRFMYNMRSRFGTKLIEMNDVPKAMLKNKNHVSATGFISDQTPSSVNAYWLWFLNQPTPVFKGTELLAKKFNYPVIYFSVRRIARGKYKCTGHLLCAEPKLTADGEITRLHTKALEDDIKIQPEIWLWSHRRWKHKPDESILLKLKENFVAN